MRETILSSKEISEGILGTTQSCRNIVAAFADGRLLAPTHGARMKHSDLRAAPGFARGLNLNAPGRVLYNSRDVAEALSIIGDAPNLLESGGGLSRTGKPVPRMAGKWVQGALALLEPFEQFPDEEEEIIAGIKTVTPRYPMFSLLSTLPAPKKPTKLFS